MRCNTKWDFTGKMLVQSSNLETGDFDVDYLLTNIPLDELLVFS